MAGEPLRLDGVSDVVIEDLRILDAPEHGIELRNCSNVLIQNVEIARSGNNGIYLQDCTNVTIRNSYIHHTNTAGNLHSGYAVFLRQTGDDIRIVGNWFEDGAGGVRASDTDGADGLVLRNNFHKNAHRPPGGSQGQFVIVVQTEGLTNALITENVSRAALGEAENEDHINFYRSGGTADSPVVVSHNRIRGAGPSRSDCGIIVGDTGPGPAAPASAYVVVDSNILVDPPQGGICMTGGHHQVITNNRLFASRNAPNIRNSNVALPVWRIGGEPGSMHSNTIGGVGQENLVLWWADWNGTGAFLNSRYCPAEGSDDVIPNHGTMGEGFVRPEGWSDNDFEHTAWDEDGGNRGYTELWRSEWDQWAYYGEV